MKAVLVRNIYSKGNDVDSYGVALFVPIYSKEEPLVSPDGELVTSFTGTGYGFPQAKFQEHIPMELEGKWEKNSKYGWQFAVSYFREIIPPTCDGLKAYLARTIKGIGPRTANAIYKAFGNETADVLDNHPERLCEVKGISERKARSISEQLYATRRSRDVISYLAPYNISVRVCNLIVKTYENRAMEVICRSPYSLLEHPEFSFRTCDRIASANHLSPTAPERIKAALLHVLLQAERAEGHLCLSVYDWLRETEHLLGSLSFPDSPTTFEAQTLFNAAQELQKEQKVFICSRKDDGNAAQVVYRYEALKAEVMTARHISALRTSPCKHIPKDKLDKYVRAAEVQCGATLSDEQREAVTTCINNNVTIITGGPGTGKTTMLRVTLAVYSVLYQETSITLCAPTGKAARRMTESTGYEATTIHRALGLTDDEAVSQTLHTDFIVIDEASMIDIYLASKLFSSLKEGTKVLLVGDIDQLPSVGPGSVLSELITSKVLPCVTLTKVYRQKGTSRVAVNAAHIREGNHSLEFGDDFIFVEADDQEKAAAAIVNSYMSELSNGTPLDELIILSPRREQLPSSAYVLAERVRDLVNPSRLSSSPELGSSTCSFRLGDRVIQLKNTGLVNNGDIGIITRVCAETPEDPAYLVVDFGDRRLVEYAVEDLHQLRLAYACTIHKSQGSEFEVVILSLSSSYGRMLQRNLVYTGITRAKRKVILVGDKKALVTAVKTVNTHSRRTLLAYRLREIANNL